MEWDLSYSPAESPVGSGVLRWRTPSLASDSSGGNRDEGGRWFCRRGIEWWGTDPWARWTRSDPDGLSGMGGGQVPRRVRVTGVRGVGGRAWRGRGVLGPVHVSECVDGGPTTRVHGRQTDGKREGWPGGEGRRVTHLEGTGSVEGGDVRVFGPDGWSDPGVWDPGVSRGKLEGYPPMFRVP